MKTSYAFLSYFMLFFSFSLQSCSKFATLSSSSHPFDARSQLNSVANEHAGRLNDYIADSIGVTIKASYADCPNSAEKVDLYLIINNAPVIQNRCYINSAPSNNSSLCTFKQTQPLGKDITGGFVRIWRVGPDCSTYADEMGDSSGYDDFPIKGQLSENYSYNSELQSRLVTITKPSYILKIDPHGGATYELSSTRNPQPDGAWINSIHANVGAALQIDIQSGAPKSLTATPCGGQGNYNPTQAGSSCGYVNKTSFPPKAPSPTNPASGLTIFCDHVLNNLCTSAVSNLLVGTHRMMNWDYGENSEGPYSQNDQMYLSQETNAEDNFVEYDLQIQNRGADIVGAIEIPTYYFRNEFHSVTWANSRGVISNYNIPINRTGNDANNFNKVLGTDEPQWVTFQNNGITGNDSYTLAWFYDTDFSHDIDTSWVGKGWAVSETDAYHQIKLSNATSIHLRQNKIYHVKYVVFPFRADETIASRFGTMKVSEVIFHLKKEFLPTPLKMFAVKKSNTGTNTTELFGLSSTNFFSNMFIATGTGLPVVGDNVLYRMADYDGDGIPDLIAIYTSNTGSGKVEIHILSGASNYQSFILHVATALPAVSPGWEFQFGDWDGDHIPDLFCINKTSSGSGMTEVHILSGASLYQSFILHTTTALGLTGAAFEFHLTDWDHDGIPDLVGLFTNGSASGMVEVHVLSGASSFQNFLVHSTSALPESSRYQLSMMDYDGDGTPDLVMVPKGATGSGSAEVHILSGRDLGHGTFGDFIMHLGTAMPATDDSFDVQMYETE